MKRIIIIEDHPIVLLSLKSGLHGQGGINVVDTFTSGGAVFECKNLKNVDLALLDINLPDVDGFQVCRFLHEEYPHMKIIGISSFEDAEYINRFIQLGANGYMVKGTRNTDMITAIDEVMAGNSFFCEISKRALLSKNSGWDESIKLTIREKKIIELLRLGSSTSEIAKQLGESKITATLFINLLKEKTHFYNLDIGITIP